MNRSTKVWLIAACFLMISGLCLCAVAVGSFNWDFNELNKAQFETNTYSFSEGFSTISIQTDTADIHFVPSTDGKANVICYEDIKVKHTVRVENDTLYIKVVSEKEWFDYIGFHFDTQKITLSIPDGSYDSLQIRTATGDVSVPEGFQFKNTEIIASTGDIFVSAPVENTLSIQTSTGDIHVQNISAGALSLRVSTGKVTVSGVNCRGDMTVNVSTGKTELSDITCQNFITNGDTGDLTMKNVVAAHKFSIERSTGDVSFEGCDAATAYILTDTGSVTGSFLSPKMFVTESDTEKVDVPHSATGGRCEITTDTGNIRIK